MAQYQKKTLTFNKNILHKDCNAENQHGVYVSNRIITEGCSVRLGFGATFALCALGFCFFIQILCSFHALEIHSWYVYLVFLAECAQHLQELILSWKKIPAFAAFICDQMRDTIGCSRSCTGKTWRTCHVSKTHALLSRSIADFDWLKMWKSFPASSSLKHQSPILWACYQPQCPAPERA